MRSISSMAGSIEARTKMTTESEFSTGLDVSARTLRNGPNTVSGSTVSNTELSEFFSAH